MSCSYRKKTISAIFLVALIGLAIVFLTGTRSITVSNAAFMELIENNKIESAQFTSGSEQVIGYPREGSKLIYTYTDTITDSNHPPKLYEMLKKHKDKVKILLDYAPVEDNFKRIMNTKK